MKNLPSQAGKSGSVSAWQIFIVSVAALYLELFIIRWIGTEVRVFSYVQNLILIACFLVVGVGCLNKDGKMPSTLSSLRDVTYLVLIVTRTTGLNCVNVL